MKLHEYRNIVERVQGGTVPASFALEILNAADEELQQVHGEFTLAQAVGLSGRSRSWFERRLPAWARQGLARKPGREWLLKGAVIPRQQTTGTRGFDETLSDDEILRQLRELDRVA